METIQSENRLKNQVNHEVMTADQMEPVGDSESLGHIQCKNCSFSCFSEDRFCAQCGQKTSTDRLSVSVVFQEVMANFFQLDQGFFRTIRDLTFAPAQALSDYLKGTRARYLGPAKYFLFGFLIFSFSSGALLQKLQLKEALQTGLQQIDRLVEKKAAAPKGKIKETSAEKDETFHLNLGGGLEIFTNSSSQKMKIKAEGREIELASHRLGDVLRAWLPEFTLSFNKYFQLYFLLWLPLISITGFLCLRKKSLGFSEQFVVHLFLFGHLLLFTGVLVMAELVFIEFDWNPFGLFVLFGFSWLYYWKTLAEVALGSGFKNFFISLSLGSFVSVLFCSLFAGLVMLAARESFLEMIRTYG